MSPYAWLYLGSNVEIRAVHVERAQYRPIGKKYKT